MGTDVLKNLSSFKIIETYNKLNIKRQAKKVVTNKSEKISDQSFDVSDFCLLSQMQNTLTFASDIFLK